MSDRNYWTTLRQRKISRRTMLGASAKAGVGVAGLALVGCGDDDEPDAGAVAAERAAAAAEEAAAAAVAAGDARAADSEAAAAVAAAAADAAADAADAAGEAADAAGEASAAAGEASAAASQAASAADAAAALAAEAAESEDAGNAAAAAEAAAAAAAQAADAAGAAGDAAAAAVADAAAQAAEAAAQAARDVAAAVEAGTATAAAAQAAIDNAAEAAAAAAAAAGEASAAAGAAAAAAGEAAATAQETAATAAAVADAAAETAAAAVAAAEEAADAAREAAESAAMAAAEPEGPAAGETDFNATVRVVIVEAEGGLDAQGPGSFGPQAVMHTDAMMVFDQFSKELVAVSGSFEWVADDNTEAVFHVKPGMTFHDGAPVTAADVKFSMDRIGGIAPYNADGTYPSNFAYVYAPVAGEITVPDELTVHIPMKPDASAFGLMGRSFPIVPKHIIEEIGDEEYNNTGLASGPWQHESYEPGDLVVSSRFEGYHVEAGSTHRQHKPYIKEMRQIVRPEPLSRVAALEAGEADLAVGLPPELVATFVDSDDFNVESELGPRNHHIAFNTLRPLADGSTPFQDIRVRRAMNHALNFDAFRESLTGREERSYGISSNSIGHMTDEQKARLTYEYDPEKARALLAEAGYPDGFHMPYWAHLGFGEDLTSVHLALQQDLEKVGITTDLQIDVHAVFRPRLGAIADDGIHEAPGIHYYFFNHAADPVQNIGAWVDEAGSIAMSQLPGSGIQELVDAQRAEFDQFERARILNELAVAMYENAMFLFFMEPVTQVVVRKNLEWINHGGSRNHNSYWGIRPLVT